MMVAKPTAVTALLACVIVSAGAQSRGVQGSPSNLSLFPTPLVRQRIPLTKALSEVGVQVRGGYVLFGIEVELKDGHEPVVNLDLKPGATLGEALKQILGQLPDYDSEVLSDHMINVFPRGTKEDPDNLLNIRLSRFEIVDEHPGHILSRPQDFMPELRARLQPKQPGPLGGYGYGGSILEGTEPAITLHLRNVTVRDALNAVSEEMEKYPATYVPTGWIHTFVVNPKVPINAKDSWTFHWSVPQDWKQEDKTKPRP